MRLSVGILALAMALAGCAGGRPSVAPTATPAPAGQPLAVAGYDGRIEPIAAPIDLVYAAARFSSTTTIGVEGSRGSAPRSNSLVAYLDGELVAEGDRIRAGIVTDRIEIDGAPSRGNGPLLAQDVLLDRKGRLIELASRWPSHDATGEPLSDRYRALEQRWRERLPILAAEPVVSGAVAYEDTGLLVPMQQMLQNRAFELRPVEPLRAVAVGLTDCAGRRCVIARHEGEAELVTQRGMLHVTAGGYVRLDVTTGLIVDELATVTLDSPGGSRLVMTIRTTSKVL
ncbi:MAG TPA: hypothetical protein PKA13_02530 [Geminicoccaceae bacterium]|nr:hypothetical protein [Geminicoccus sp.]HMU48621.1 hypothetical protein [Geminicoccaceae bacterium]